jgi:glutaredoxin
MTRVTVYSRNGCHLCENAIGEIKNFSKEFTFQLEEIFIDGNTELEKKYGEEVPVILINGNPHDFFKVDPERFRSAMKKESRPHQ